MEEVRCSQGKPEGAPPMAQEVGHELAQRRMERRQQVGTARKSLLGAVGDGLQGVRRRKSLVSAWEGGRAGTGQGCRRRNRSWGKDEIRLGFVQEVVETYGHS